MTSYIFAGVPSSTLYQYFLFYYNVMFLKLWIDTSSSSSECVVGGGPLCSLLLSFQSSAALQASRAVKCVTFRTSRYQVHRGLPGFLRQPGCGTMPACASTDAWRTSCAVPSGKRLTCPNRASFLSLMTARMSARPVFSVTAELVTKSDHRMLRMRRWHCMWKACSLLPSALRMVHVSAPWRRDDWTQMCIF